MSLEQALALGRKRHEAGCLEEAATIYRQIVGKLTDHADAWHLLGVTALQQGRYAEAVEHIEKAVSARPGFVRAINNLGVAHKALGELEKAEAVLGQALEADPDTVDTLFNLGTVLQAAGKIPQAANAYRKVIALEPESVDALCALASVLPAIGDPEGAVEICRKALTIDHTFANAYLHLANALKALGQKKAAIRALRDGVSKQPDFAEAWLSLADVLRDSLRLPEALQAYRRGIALRPDLVEAVDSVGPTGRVGCAHKFHLIDKEWCLPPFDPAQVWLLPIDPLIQTARTRQPQEIPFTEICFPRSIASLARYEACDTRYPGIVLANAANPCDRKYRLVDGNHRIQKLLALGQNGGRFHVFTLDEVHGLVREYSHYIYES